MKEEMERRRREKARRVPVNDTTLIVQKGQIDVNDLFLKIDQKLKEKKNGQKLC